MVLRGLAPLLIRAIYTIIYNIDAISQPFNIQIQCGIIKDKVYLFFSLQRAVVQALDKL